MKRSAGFVRVAAGALAIAAAMAAGGCSLMTPSLSELEAEQATAAVAAPVIKEDGVLTVALNPADAPLAMAGEGDEITGYSVDLAAALADELGLDVKFVGSASASAALGDGEADIYLSAPSSEQSDDVDVLGTTMTDATAVFTKAEGDVDASTAAQAMASATVAVQDQSASQDILVRTGIECEQVTCSNINECFEALDAGEATYVVCDAIAGEYLARSYEDVALVGTLDRAQNHGVAVSAGNVDLSSAVSDALDAISADGTLDAVYARWFGENPLDLTSMQLPGVEVGERAASDEGQDGGQEDAAAE